MTDADLSQFGVGTPDPSPEPDADDMDSVETSTDTDDTDLGVECAVDGCDERLAGLGNGFGFSRGNVCQDCADYYHRHNHWPDEDEGPCVECKIDEGYVRHECDVCEFDAVILDPPATCQYCGLEVDDV